MNLLEAPLVVNNSYPLVTGLKSKTAEGYAGRRTLTN